jgi:hypothetical protein
MTTKSSAAILKPDAHKKVKIAVLVSESNPSMLALEQALKTNVFDVYRFSDALKMKDWILVNTNAVVIFPMVLREDSIRVIPIVRAAMSLKKNSRLKFLAVSDLVQKIREDSPAQDTIRILQAIMDFVPLTISGPELISKINQYTSELSQEDETSTKKRDYLLLRLDDFPRTIEEVLDAYNQGVNTINRMIKASECVLLALDEGMNCYKVVRSSNPVRNDGVWDFSHINIIPRRDMISSAGAYYFHPVKNFLTAEGARPTNGFLYVSRDQVKRALNTDEVKLLECLAFEIEGMSQTYVANTE